MAKRIGDYKLLDAIGVGTVGSVYRAKNRKTGQKVALKILLPSVSADHNILRRFEREMSILEKLDHRNIVRYLEDGKHEGRLYYVMELVDSGSLKDEMQIHGRLPWPQVCRYGIQISSALQHAHNFGIVHRDLKPANLFLTDTGQLKLGDFGIALDRHAVGLTDSGLTVGTYAYMSPEQIRADNDVSDRTDLYALGCLLFEMLTGRHPFEGSNFAQIFEQHLNTAPPRVRQFISDCPEELEQIIVRLMAKQPESRPFNARFVQGYLQEVLNKYPLHLQEAAERAVSRNRAVYRAGASLQPSTGPMVGEGLAFDRVSWRAIAGLIALVIAIVAAFWAVGQFGN
jgi:serine/threonine protein kinase